MDGLIYPFLPSALPSLCRVDIGTKMLFALTFEIMLSDCLSNPGERAHHLHLTQCDLNTQNLNPETNSHAKCLERRIHLLTGFFSLSLSFFLILS